MSEKNPESLTALNLPLDYHELSPRGQCAARLAGVRNQSPPDNFVRAWTLFRTYYLQQLPPGIFYKDFKESPPFHYDLIRDVAAYRLNAWACPRGSAKSTILGTELPLFLVLTRSHFDILMILAKEKMVQKRLGRIMEMLEGNPFILNDFGKMRPPRGAKMWNHGIMQLVNGSQITGMPVEGKMLGERPDMILPDDPEHDKALSSDSNPAYLREAFERLLYGILFPMLRGGSCMGWIGTLLDARSFLWKFIHSEEDHIKKFWNRRNLAIWTPEGKSIWPEYWSPGTIKMLQETMPAEYFQTHFMNNPGVGRAGLLKLDPVFCTYSIEPENDWSADAPLHSNATLIAHRPIPVETDKVDVDVQYTAEKSERPFGETVRAMHRVITVDFGFSQKRGSDYSCIHVLGFENNDTFRSTLWSLDIWLGHEKISRVIDLVWEYALRWRVRMIAAEAVAQQHQIVDQLKEYGQSRMGESVGGERGWMPVVLHLTYSGGVKKPDRIASLGWWFDRFRIKLPVQRRFTFPYRELFTEIERYSFPRAGTPHDDAVDTLAMYPFIGSGNPKTGPAEPGEKHIDPLKEIREGRLAGDNGIPYINSLRPEEIPVEDLRRIHNEGRKGREREEGIVWTPA